MPEFVSMGAFKEIPGYDNYYTNLFGVVTNKRGHVLTTTMTRKGPVVDLRNKGQRERVLVSELLEKVRNDHAIDRLD